MTDKEYNHLVELRNKCYRDRRDRETEINYFTGFNDGYEKGRESLEKENEKLTEELKYAETHCLFHDNCPIQKENTELRKVAEFQQSSNMSRHFENKKLKEGLAVGSILNKGLNSLNKALEEERDKYRNMVFYKDEQLTKAKELLEKFVRLENCTLDYDDIKEAEQFLDSEVEK